MDEERDPSQMLVRQRVRNRLIEYFEVASSFDEQREYQRAVPMISVPNEMINQFDDWVDGDNLDWFSEPVFTVSEQAAIRNFQAVWESVAADTPDVMPPIEELIGTEVWTRLRLGAEAALEVFMVRGRLDEEREEF